MNPNEPSIDQPANNVSKTPPSLEALLEHIETLLPNDTETSVTTVVLYLDSKGSERLIVTGLRYPSGSLGQIRFDYRAPEGSSLIDLDLTSVSMQGYDMKQNPDAATVTRHTLDIAATALWLDDLISHGTVQEL